MSTRRSIAGPSRLADVARHAGGWTASVSRRVAGVTHALVQAGLGIRPNHFAQIDRARRVASWRICLAQGPADLADRTTAASCSNDSLAFGVMIEARSRGAAVPDQLRVTGFDDIALFAHLVPALTTIRIPVDEMGELIAPYIVQVLQRESASQPAALENECVVHGITASPPGQPMASFPIPRP